MADHTPARVPDVLVVDDEPDVSALLVAYLHRWECTVRVAYTGEEAVVLARQSPPDVAIVDILLPGIDGWETIEQIRSQPGSQHCGFVTMSIADGGAHPPDFDSCLHKPFVWNDIKRVVRPLLDAGART
jgi:CheY-like chemotaxis protein